MSEQDGVIYERLQALAARVMQAPDGDPAAAIEYVRLIVENRFSVISQSAHLAYLRPPPGREDEYSLRAELEGQRAGNEELRFRLELLRKQLADARKRLPTAPRRSRAKGRHTGAA